MILLINYSVPYQVSTGETLVASMSSNCFLGLPFELNGWPKGVMLTLGCLDISTFSRLMVLSIKATAIQNWLKP